MAPISAWSSRLFFATVGFSIPVSALFDTDALGYGALLTLLAVLSKVVTGVWAGTAVRWVVGWAMVGRGELGFVMAEEGYESGVTSRLTFSVTVWALLLATLLSPVALRYVLAQQRQQRKDARAPAVTPEATRPVESRAQIQIQAVYPAHPHRSCEA